MQKFLAYLYRFSSRYIIKILMARIAKISDDEIVALLPPSFAIRMLSYPRVMAGYYRAIIGPATYARSAFGIR